MSKNTIDGVTEEVTSVTDVPSSSETHAHEMSVDSESPVTLSDTKELGVSESTSFSTLPSLEDGEYQSSPSSTEGKSQLRDFLSVAKAKWDNVPQGWMQQRTNKDD